MRKEEKDKKIRPDLRGRQIVPKIKARPHRRTCADGGDTDREIYPKIVCEAKGRVRDFGVNFVEGESKGGNRSLRQRRGRLLPSLRGPSGAAVDRRHAGVHRQKSLRAVGPDEPALLTVAHDLADQFAVILGLDIDPVRHSFPSSNSVPRQAAPKPRRACFYYATV